MSLSLDGEGRMRRLSRWGVESGGLRAASILFVQLGGLVLGAVLAAQTGLRVDAASFGVVFVALELGLLRGLVLAAAIGYLADLFSGQPHGLWMTGAVASFAALRLFVFRVVGAQALTVALLAGFAALVAGLARAILLGSVGQPAPAASALLGLAALTAAGGPIAYRLFSFASDRFKKRDEQLFKGG